MGRPRDMVVALSMVNISHVTAALLLNSLGLCLRHRKGQKQRDPVQTNTAGAERGCAFISSDTAAIS